MRRRLRAALSTWKVVKKLPSRAEILVIYVSCSPELLDSGDPSAALLVANEAHTAALRAVTTRMEQR